jgi:hypothetical protein
MARAECDARGCLLGEPAWLDAECRSAADLPLMVTDALRSGAPVGQRLWLWYDALPTHVLELPAAQVAGLRDAALHQALLFEAEQETGVDMARQQLAHILLGEQDSHCRYWITLAPEAALLEIQRVAARHGCGLAGLLHPGGLPKPLSPKAHKEDWARLEAWP